VICEVWFVVSPVTVTVAPFRVTVPLVALKEYEFDAE
jgi:hypothetical protein